MRLPFPQVVIPGILLLIFSATGSARDDWRWLEAPDFSILSDASTRDVETFALEYAAFRITLHEFFAGEGARTPRPIIILFRRDRDFEKHAPTPAGRGKRMLMFTTEIDSGALLALSLRGDRWQALQTAFEFDTMWTLRRLGYFVPTWMRQGAGEVLSTHRVSHGEREIGVTRRDLFSVLVEEGTLKWDKFFGIGVGSAEYDGDEASGAFHAQAWGLMHWLLLEDQDGPKRFKALAQKLRREDARAAVASVMGVEDLDRSTAREIRRQRDVIKRPFDEAAVRASWNTRPAKELELRVYLADLLAASGAVAEADWEIEQCLATAPDDPLVQEAAARRNLRHRRMDLAVDHYRRAIEAGSANPVAYLLSAEQRLNDSASGRRDIAGSGIVPAVNAALAEIRRSLELDPGNPTAYRLLGRACFVSREVPEGALDELERGAGPGSDGAWARMYRALVAERLEKWEVALQEFTALASGPDVPESVRRQAERQLLQLAFRELIKDVDRLALAGDFAGANARWAAAADDFADSAMCESYTKMGRWIEQQEEASRRRALQPDLDHVQELVRDFKFSDAIEFAKQKRSDASDDATRKTWDRLLPDLHAAAAADLARIAFHDRQWEKAVELSEEFLETYPSNRYADEVRGYLGKSRLRVGAPSHQGSAD